MLLSMENGSSGQKSFRGIDYLKITILGFALAAVANAMHAIILPLRVEEFIGAGHKSTFLGLVTFTGLLVAILIQPIAGAISDRSGFRWGRRRPFILIGILAALVWLAGLGAVGGFAAVFIFWCLMQASLNTAQGPFQALIPDLAPEGKRGLASGIKNLLEIAGGVALLRLIGYFMGRSTTGSNEFWLWLSLGVIGLALLITMLITLFTVKEAPGVKAEYLPWTAVLHNTFNLNLKGHSGFVFFLVSRLLFIMALTSLQTFALYYFQDVVGIANPAEITADLITAVGIAMLIVVYPAGHYSDKIGRKSILIGSSFLGASGVAVIFLFHSYALILFGGVLIGVGAGAFLSTNWALAIDLIPPGEAGRYLGIANLASAGGAALARLIGPVIDLFNGISPGAGYSVMLGACFIYFIAAALLIWRIKPIKMTASNP
jgi:Na+/melibiose symporter-like transporter